MLLLLFFIAGSMKWLKPKKQSTPLREVQEEEDEEVLKPKSILQKVGTQIL